MNKSAVLHTLGNLLIMLAAIMVVPLAIAVGESGARSPQAMAFCVSVIASTLMGLGLRKIFKQDWTLLGVAEGFAIVALGWGVLTLFGSLPLYLYSRSLHLGYSFTDAYFEIMSGFTTTGSTIITNIEILPKGILFWRSLTHWLGGMGIVVLSVAILPVLGIGAYQMFKAEVSGPEKDRLKPRVAETAKTLWRVYALLTLAEILLLWIHPGMSFFDAVCHTFGTLGTGGFSTKNASIAYYDSAYIDWVIIIFMYLAGCNFVLHYHVIKGEPLSYFRDPEWRFFTIFTVVCVILVTFSLRHGKIENHEFKVTSDSGESVCFKYDQKDIDRETEKVRGPLWQTVRYAAFQVISITTVTGYGTANFDLWPNFCRFLLVLLMFIGGCAGSTSGGIKVRRVMLLTKIAYRGLMKLVRPHAVVRIKMGEVVIDEETVSNVATFFFLYLLLFASATLVMATMLPDLVTAFSSVAAVMGNVGPGLAGVGAAQNFANIPAPGKWVLIFCMLAGRLEIYSLFVLFIPLAWRK